LVRQPKIAVFQAEIEVRIHRTPVLKVLIKVLHEDILTHLSIVNSLHATNKASTKMQKLSATTTFEFLLHR